jgi:ubiquinone biosynthesis protein
MHQKTADQISMARLLTQLFEYTEVFEMQTRLELVFLQKTMVVVEGVGRNLDPQLDMWKVAEPVISEWVARNLGPAGQAKAAATALGHAVRLLADAPDILQKAGQALGSLADTGTKGLQLSDETMRIIARAGHSRSRTIALWAIALALGLIAAQMV